MWVKLYSIGLASTWHAAMCMPPIRRAHQSQKCKVACCFCPAGGVYAWSQANANGLVPLALEPSPGFSKSCSCESIAWDAQEGALAASYRSSLTQGGQACHLLYKLVQEHDTEDRSPVLDEKVGSNDALYHQLLLVQHLSVASSVACHKDLHHSPLLACVQHCSGS